MLSASHQRAAASLRMLPIQPCENGGGISWMTTRRVLALASGTRSMTSRSAGAIVTQSDLGAAATISPGLGADGVTLPEAIAAEAWARAGEGARRSARTARSK